MNTEAIHFINNAVLTMAKGLRYTVADLAPNTTADLFNQGNTNLVIWSGASDATIYGDAHVNWAFRAWHDALHIKHGLIFSIDAEIELARIQASQCSSVLMAELVYCEIAGQAEALRQTGKFISDQAAFTLQYLQARGLINVTRLRSNCVWHMEGEGRLIMWHIEDWAGNVKFFGKVFDTFDAGEYYLACYLGESYDEYRQEYYVVEI
jgi:hypothetical protein